ncbi:MAG: nickel pincer cofactor biosynthesis protein LarC [Deltaproteobacteria bacterium]|nr:nickel pincer cofactor biosynthesis protein LarC [Deltaproteobacteria bacterium]
MADLLWLEPVGGAAGDMFLAAALHLGVPRDELTRHLGALGVPGWRLEVRDAEANGIHGLHLDVELEGPQPHGRGFTEIAALFRQAPLPPRARQAALAMLERVARAESRVHGVPLEQVHFHEVGAVDSIVDLCGAALVLELLGWPRAVASPPELGQGFQKTHHGVLPVPPPAVLEIMQGALVRPGGPQGEAVTPTGAAILRELFEIGTPPPFVPRRTGYGVGTSRWSDRPNVLRLTSGDRSPAGGELWLLEANLDDCPGQLVARAIEAALLAGALDAWAAPVTMKKGRPGLILGALAPAARREAVAHVFLRETTTLGVRFRAVERLEAERELLPVETPYGPVRVKVGRLGGEVLNAHPEWDDCAVRAREHGVPVKRVLDAAAAAYWKR